MPWQRRYPARPLPGRRADAVRADGPVNTPREDQLIATPGHEHAASTACDCGRPQRRKAVAVELKEVQGARGVADGGVPSLGAISDELVGSARWVPGVTGVAPSQRVAAREVEMSKRKQLEAGLAELKDTIAPLLTTMRAT